MDMSYSLVSSSVFIHQDPRKPFRCAFVYSSDLTTNPLTFSLKGSHGGCRLNDNLDGTFTILSKDGAGSAVVATRVPMDVEEVVEPKRPTYPWSSRKHVVWVSARAADESPTPAAMETTPDPTPMLSPSPEELDGFSDTDLNHTANGRPYREWWGEICVLQGES